MRVESLTLRWRKNGSLISVHRPPHSSRTGRRQQPSVAHAPPIDVDADLVLPQKVGRHEGVVIAVHERLHASSGAEAATAQGAQHPLALALHPALTRGWAAEGARRKVVRLYLAQAHVLVERPRRGAQAEPGQG